MLIILFFLLNISPANCTDRQLIKQPFMVCSESHFLHSDCYDLWKTTKPSCPTCNNESLMLVHSAYFKISDPEICAICQYPHAEKPAIGLPRITISVPTVPCVLPTMVLPKTKSPEIDQETYHAEHTRSLQLAKNIKNLKDRKAMLDAIRAIHASRFLHKRK